MLVSKACKDDGMQQQRAHLLGALCKQEAMLLLNNESAP